MVRTVEGSLKSPLTSPLSDVEMLTLGALGSGESDFPTLWVFETHSVQGDKPHQSNLSRTA
jgi:hypothetical protein